MAINKIKLKQIDADFPALVGQYGSGYFASTGSLNSLSGQSVKYSDLATGAFVYTTGNQSISGNKNFLSRPAISGVGIATLSETVSIDGDNAIFGDNTFTGSNIFLNSTKFQNNNVQFDNSSFTFVDSTSLDNLTNSLTKFVKTTGNQIVDGVKTFRSGIKVGGAGGSGVLYSGQINPVYVSGITGNSNRYLTFVENTGNGFKNMQMHTGLRYNASTETLEVKIFSGNLSGNSLTASSATTATRLSGKNPIASINGTGFDGSQDIIIRPSGNLDSSDNIRYLLFTDNTNNGYKNISFDNKIGVNPSSGFISGSTFIGGFRGNALNAFTAAALDIGTVASGGEINFNFPAGVPSYIMNSGAFYPNPPTGSSLTARDLGLTTSRWRNIFVGATVIGTSDRNLKTEISEIPDSWLDAWQEVDYVRYKFKDSVAQKGLSGARWHLGHIAQDIYEKFDAHNLNAFDIGMLCYDKWDESIDQNGNVTPSGEIWSIRPDECQFMEMALMRRSINRLKSGILI
jgi:hypothetical protein